VFTLYADVKERRRPSRRLKVVAARGRSGVGLTGLEPVTLRLSSACSNQLSYRPEKCTGKGIGRGAAHPLQASQILRSLHAAHGGKGIRTPDIQLAKLALYQLSYAPGKLYYPGKSVFRGGCRAKIELWVTRPQVVALSRYHGVLG
jgi:hypothetical protein